MIQGYVYINARSIKYPSKQVGSTESDYWPIEYDYWPSESKGFCSVLCLNDAIREDMGVR